MSSRIGNGCVSRTAQTQIRSGDRGHGVVGDLEPGEGAGRAEDAGTVLAEDVDDVRIGHFADRVGIDGDDALRPTPLHDGANATADPRA